MTSKPCRNCGATTQRDYCEACEFMKPVDACKRLRISRTTIWRYIKDGRLTPRRISERKILILRSEVEALLG